MQLTPFVLIPYSANDPLWLPTQVCCPKAYLVLSPSCPSELPREHFKNNDTGASPEANCTRISEGGAQHRYF